MPNSLPLLIATPLATWERDGLAAALAGAGLPADDVREKGPLFWRFSATDDTPAGFGGLEVHDDLALLRSVVVLPVVRQHGFGDAIVASLENEARAHNCSQMWLLTTSARRYFERLGYQVDLDVPDAIRGSRQFALLCPPVADIMVKAL
ncbi:MAG: GNAT family N-acetyltransferase [Xanthobacteraceae bacterium]|nr:MAG: GNAT family N-acetyltransferase [Xanthobacteraceae bacterium]